VGALVDVMRVAATGDPSRAVVDVGGLREIRDIECEILVVGGGTGGVAAAWAAARSGRSVCLVEETDWIGGQLTAQGVSALDEHDHIEAFGGTRTYYRLREAIRDHYRPLARAGEADLNPGTCWVTRLAFEPRVALRTLEGFLAPEIEAGRLTIFLRTKAAAAEARDDRVVSVLAVNLEDGRAIRFRPEFVLDATELGDLLPLTGAEHVVGAEAKHETGEPHAQPVEPKPHCVQSFTYTFALERRPAGERHVVPKPEKYEHYRDGQPYTLRIQVHGGEIYSEESGWLDYQVLERAPGTKGALWTYRRLIDRDQFRDGFPHDISMFNWPGNDYRDMSILDRSPVEVARALQDAKRVSLGFLYWLQTEAPHPGGRPGFPELRLCPDVMGSMDGLSKHPYIREARRIKALKTVVEQEVSADHQPGPRAAHFPDSVGIGWYPIDIHRAGEEDVGMSCRTVRRNSPFSSQTVGCASTKACVPSAGAARPWLSLRHITQRTCACLSLRVKYQCPLRYALKPVTSPRTHSRVNPPSISCRARRVTSATVQARSPGPMPADVNRSGAFTAARPAPCCRGAS